MTNDNPIFKTITDVLGLGNKPKSFIEKISGLERMMGASLNRDSAWWSDPSSASPHYSALLRAEKGASLTEGALSASGKEVGFLFNKLNKMGLVPSEAESVFTRISKLGGNLIFNESNNSLFYSTGSSVTPLPTSVGPGLISLNNTNRKVNNLLMGGSEVGFTSAFYSAASLLSSEDAVNLHRGLRGVFKEQFRGTRSLGSLIMGGVSTRGMLTPEEGFWTGARLLATDAYTNPSLKLGIDQFRNANSAFAMLVKTAGRKVFSGLSPDQLDYNQAFSLIENQKSSYISTLTNYLVDTGSINTIPFIKPEYLGTKNKFLVGSQLLTEIFGSKFEKHSITKGLYQLAKIRSTTAEQIENIISMGENPYASYMTASMKGIEGATREMTFKVGVVDTTSDVFSKLYFQEGGGILTSSGARKLAFKAPIGSMKIGSPSLETIGAVERLFGINMASGNKLTGLSSGMFSLSDFKAASRGTGQLTAVQQDIRTLIQSSRKYRGMLGQIANTGGVLSKAELTEGALTLDFSSKGAITPDSIETVFGGRRFTNQRIDHSALKGIIPESSLGQVDVLISADEFNKTFGANAFLTNFIEKVRKRDDAEAIFKETFGQTSYLPISSKGFTGMTIPVVTDHDSAFLAAQGMLKKWKEDPKYAKLAEEVEHGTKVIDQQFINSGIKGISVFGLGGGMRTDFMGDINMMSPVRITPSKMATIAKGSRLLGYKFAEMDPMFDILRKNSVPWRYGDIGIDAMSGELSLGSNHILRRFSNALLGDPGTIHPGEIISLRDGGMFKGDIKLKSLPSSMSMFSHSGGGIPLSELSDTILGQKSDLLYLDLGSTKKLNLLGVPGGERDYRYLPIPLKYLRLNKGTHNNLVVGKSHPGYEMLSSLIDIQQNQAFDSGSPLAYTEVLRGLAGKKGLFNRTSTILFNMGTRARLVAQSGNYYTPQSLLDPDQAFNSFISKAGFEDYLTRKSGISKMTGTQAKQIRASVKNRGFFYAMLNADPAQRGEHFQVHRIYVDKGLSGHKIGQLNLSMHPLMYRMFERDVDRDAISMVPLTGKGIASSLEERIARQKKAIAPFMWYLNFEQRAAKNSTSHGRFSALQFESVSKFINQIIGSPKSLGYSITRSTDSLMNELVAYGVEGAKNLGILGAGVSEDMVTKAIAPYVGDSEKLPVVQALLQNLYQGGVQKGQSKKGLEEVAEGLVRIGQEFRGGAYNPTESIRKATNLIEEFLSDDSNKVRAFAAMDYMAEKGIGGLDSASVQLMKQDLERSLTESLSGEAAERFAKFKTTIVRAQSSLLGEYLGSAMPLAASVRRAPKTVAGIIQKNISDSTEKTEILDSVLGAASGKIVPHVSRDIGPREFKALEKAVEKSKWISSIKALINSENGKFGLGLGIGAVAGATIAGLARGPEAPMPRDVDGRQPVDIGPEVFQNSPKVYGTNQTFYASKKRSPETFSPVGGYNFSLRDSSRVTIKDKTSPYSPYLLDKEIRNASKSDYSY